jgi:hypothetical protein
MTEARDKRAFVFPDEPGQPLDLLSAAGQESTNGRVGAYTQES